MSRCWREIGVFGDGSCVKLREHVHCRNCEVYVHAGGALFARSAEPLPADTFAGPQALTRAEKRAGLLVFRLNDGHYALALSTILEVGNNRFARRLAHRYGGLLEGVVNVRGELHLMASLARLLALSEAPTPPATARLVVVGTATEPWVIRVDEVTGVVHLPHSALETPPSSMPTSLLPYIDAVAWVETRHVYLLNAERVIAAFVSAQY